MESHRANIRSGERGKADSEVMVVKKAGGETEKKPNQRFESACRVATFLREGNVESAEEKCTCSVSKKYILPS